MAEGQTKFIESFEKGDIIWNEGDTGEEMYIVKMGLVECVRSMGDDEMVINTLGANEFFGEMALFSEPERTFTARAAERTVLIKINKRMLENQFSKVPDWLVNMINTIADRIKKTSKGVQINFDVSMEYSIIKLILLMMEEYGIPEEKGKSINLLLLRNEIIKVLGIKEEKIDSWLKKLNIVNLISVIGKKDKLIVPDPNRLESFAEYLATKSESDLAEEIELDPTQAKSFERIYKLLYR